MRNNAVFMTICLLGAALFVSSCSKEAIEETTLLSGQQKISSPSEIMASQLDIIEGAQIFEGKTSKDLASTGECAKCHTKEEVAISIKKNNGDLTGIINDKVHGKMGLTVSEVAKVKAYLTQ